MVIRDLKHEVDPEAVWPVEQQALGSEGCSHLAVLEPCCAQAALSPVSFCRGVWLEMWSGMGSCCSEPSSPAHQAEWTGRSLSGNWPWRPCCGCAVGAGPRAPQGRREVMACRLRPAGLQPNQAPIPGLWGKLFPSNLHHKIMSRVKWSKWSFYCSSFPPVNNLSLNYSHILGPSETSAGNSCVWDAQCPRCLASYFVSSTSW